MGSGSFLWLQVLGFPGPPSAFVWHAQTGLPGMLIYRAAGPCSSFSHNHGYYTRCHGCMSRGEKQLTIMMKSLLVAEPWPWPPTCFSGRISSPHQVRQKLEGLQWGNPSSRLGQSSGLSSWHTPPGGSLCSREDSKILTGTYLPSSALASGSSWPPGRTWVGPLGGKT